MANSGVVRDPGRLPWLEPYRAPAKRGQSNRRPATAAVIGAAGLAGVLTLLIRDVPLDSAEVPASPQASVVLPAPVDLGPPIVLAPLEAPETAAVAPEATPAAAPRAKARVRRNIRTVPTRAAYRRIVDEQVAEARLANAGPSEAAMAIASLPLPVVPRDPPRPTVNRAAQVVRGKTVQLGVYRSAGQAEAAWRSAIRDYTFLVTMPKSIEAISIRSKRFYRLQLGTPSMRHARQLCTNLRTIGRACTVA